MEHPDADTAIRVAPFPNLHVNISCGGSLLSIPSQNGLWASLHTLTTTQRQEALQWLDSYAKRQAAPLCPWMQLYNSHSSPFDRLVWETLLSIPYGQTLSYLDIAKAIGQTKAVRAVGGACGRNPMPLLIPCHRVIRSDGGLGGFSAGSTSGIEIKKRLLAFEAA